MTGRVRPLKLNTGSNCLLFCFVVVLLQQLFEYKAKNNTHCRNFPRPTPRTRTSSMLSDCEVLVPAAVENVITTHNAAGIKARIIIEGANGPTTAAADEILQDKGVFVVPGILANAGGVTASYFEWVQDRQGYFWTEARVNAAPEQIMTTAFTDVLAAETHRQQSHRRLHARYRPRRLHHPHPGHLRLSQP